VGFLADPEKNSKKSKSKMRIKIRMRIKSPSKSRRRISSSGHLSRNLALAPTPLPNLNPHLALNLRAVSPEPATAQKHADEPAGKAYVTGSTNCSFPPSLDLLFHRDLAAAFGR
jgi:hypothetical protein